MTRFLTDANRELFNRPAEEHVPSFAELRRRTDEDRATSFEKVIDPSAVVFDAVDDQIRIGIKNNGSTQLFLPSNFVLGQIGTRTSVGLPLMRKLHTKTLVGVLNETWDPTITYNDPDTGEVKTEKEGPAKFLFRHGPNGDTIRAITGPDYARLWDSTILDEIDRWLIPNGWGPTVPTINVGEHTKRAPDGSLMPALFHGDRSSFYFFSRKGDAQNGNDGYGGLARGLMVNNSVVGYSSFGWTTLYFQGMCSNFLIWNPEMVKRGKVIHRRRAIQQGIQEFKQTIMSLSNEVEPLLYERLDAAKTINFAKTQDEATERLFKSFDTTKKFAEAAVQGATLDENNLGNSALTVYSIVNGITWAAQAGEFAEDRVAKARLGGEVLEKCVQDATGGK